MADEMLMAVKSPEVIAQTELLVLRGMSDAISNLNKNMEKVYGKVDDVRERVIKIEASGLLARMDTMDSRVERANTRIDALESDKDKRSGARDIVDWFLKNTPWILALGGVGTAVFFKH